jgi:hypothetical protein
MFDKLLKAAVGIVTLPVDVVADVVTLGGSLTDKDEPYTVRKAGHIMDNLDDATNPEEKP